MAGVMSGGAAASVDHDRTDNSNVVDRLMAPKKYPHPNPQNMRKWEVMWQRGTEAAGGAKVANQLTLFWGGFPGLQMGPMQSQGS